MIGRLSGAHFAPIFCRLANRCSCDYRLIARRLLGDQPIEIGGVNTLRRLTKRSQNRSGDAQPMANRMIGRLSVVQALSLGHTFPIFAAVLDTTIPD